MLWLLIFKTCTAINSRDMYHSGDPGITVGLLQINLDHQPAFLQPPWSLLVYLGGRLALFGEWHAPTSLVGHKNREGDLHGCGEEIN